MLIALIELIEAEARQLRRATIETGFLIGMLVFAGLIAIAGVALVGWALYQYLAMHFSATTSALVLGMIALVIGGGVLWQIHRKIR